MRRRYAVGAVLSLMLAAPAGLAQAHPRHDAGAIAFVSDRDSTVAVATDEVYLIDPETRRVHRLTDDLAGVERWPTISPDGRTLAWVRFEQDGTGAARPDLTEIYRCDLRSRAGAWSCRNPRKVVGPVLNAVITWTPDSRALLYSGPANADFDADIYAISLRSGQTRNLTREAVVDGALVQNGQPTVSPDGRYFVYSRGTTGLNGADLYRRNIDGTNPVQLTAALRNDNAAEYSPNGKRLVFHSNRDDAVNFDIFIMKATVEGPDNPAVNLTGGLQTANGTKTQERAPSFSPDGRQIGFWWFTNVDPTGFTDGEIYTMRTDGSHVRNLTNNNPTDSAALTVGDIQPDWGPSPVRNARGKPLRPGFAD